MLPGLPILTADEHEFRTVIDGDPPEDESGWALISVGTVADSDGNFYIVDHWARRKDGRPMVPVDQELIGLRRRVAELERLLKDANGSISVIRAEARERISDLQTDIEHVLRELRLSNHADAEDSLRTALHNSRIGDPNA